MAENLNKRPAKSILKNSSSFDAPDGKPQKPKPRPSAKWDEMNIMATLHPPDKDYGHMKIDEPKTPFNYESLELDVDALDARELAARIRAADSTLPKSMQRRDVEDDDEDEDDATPEDKMARREFEAKRKKHYNEYYAVKLARKLLEKEEDEDEEDNTTVENDDDDENLLQSRANTERNRQMFERDRANAQKVACMTSDNCGKKGCRAKEAPSVGRKRGDKTEASTSANRKMAECGSALKCLCARFAQKK